MFGSGTHILLAGSLSFLLLGSDTGSAQQKPPPPQPVRAVSALLLYPRGPNRVVETFAIIQQANQGIPAAQMELGYRYIVGRGIPPDSVKGAQWILTAARNGVALAQYNAGILYTHAIGVEWDPFKAFGWIEQAATQELPAAQFLLGILFVDGLVVPRDPSRAYQLVNTAFAQGHADAEDALAEFKRRGFDTLDVSTPNIPAARNDSTPSLVMLHFENVKDPNVGDTTLVRELERELGHSVLTDTRDSITLEDSRADSSILRLEEEARKGIPEAYMVLGRIFEKGIGTRQDLIRAAVYYLRANRLDSPRAPIALVNLMKRDAFGTDLLRRSQAGDDDARYVWAALSAIDLDNVIGWEQALRFLTDLSDRPAPHVHACLELGFWYASGRNVVRDADRAVDLWERADAAGTREGRTRAELVRLVLNAPGQVERTSYFLREAEEGSVLAQAGFAYCARMGIGTRQDKPEAALWYRRAAQRGSLSAYYGLKNMYDELRPEEERFRIE